MDGEGRGLGEGGRGMAWGGAMRGVAWEERALEGRGMEPG